MVPKTRRYVTAVGVQVTVFSRASSGAHKYFVGNTIVLSCMQGNIAPSDIDISISG